MIAVYVLAGIGAASALLFVGTAVTAAALTIHDALVERHQSRRLTIEAAAYLQQQASK